MDNITELLRAWSDGDEDAFDRLAPYVDPILKRMAHNYLLNERREDILQTTALVNEALIKLLQEKIQWDDRKHFYAFVARRMRQVLINQAISRTAQKRDWGNRVGMTDAGFEPITKAQELIDLDEAMIRLGHIHPDKLTIVELKFYAGLTYEEIADVLGVAVRTVQRGWDFARAWLIDEMKAPGTGGEPAP